MSSLETLSLFTLPLLGMILGSFSALLIVRLPKEEPFFLTQSKCDSCGKPIPLYLNIPIFSSLFLKFRTRCCDKPILKIHFLTELLTTLVFGLNAFLFSFELALGVSLAFFWLYTITVIDLRHWIIPDVLTWGAMPLCFLASIFLLKLSPLESFGGFCFGFGFFYSMAVLYEKIRGVMGLGGGDIKFLGAIGFLIGWKGVLFTIFFSSLLGTVVGLIVIVANKSDLKQRIPYGPFLAAGAYCYLSFFSFFEKMFHI